MDQGCQTPLRRFKVSEQRMCRKSPPAVTKKHDEARVEHYFGCFSSFILDGGTDGRGSDEWACC